MTAKHPMQGPGSWFGSGEGYVVAKPERPHGGPQRRFKDHDEEGSFWSYAWGCGRRLCGACAGIDRARRGEPLCGWTSPDGDRCLFLWGHSHPGDHPLCPPHTYDHSTMTANEAKQAIQVLGFDPFAKEPSPVWRKEHPMTWALAGSPERASALEAKAGA